MIHLRELPVAVTLGRKTARRWQLGTALSMFSLIGPSRVRRGSQSLCAAVRRFTHDHITTYIYRRKQEQVSCSDEYIYAIITLSAYRMFLVV